MDERSENPTAATAVPSQPAATPDAIRDQVIEQLRNVYDPEIPVNIYELGLIYAIEVGEANAVTVKMTLTSPACPAAGSLPPEVQRKVMEVPGVTAAKVDIVWDPPWTPDLGSGLLRAARSTFERLFALQPELEVVHGGLECAVLGEKLPGVEMISIGPEVLGPHAPGERLRISGTQRFYRLLGALLDDLSS